MVNRKTVEQVQPGALLMSWQDVVKIALTGLLTGLLAFCLFLLVERYIFTPTLCSDLNAGTGRCENRLIFSAGFSIVLSGFAALIYFVKQRVYRPLLVVILSSAALWSVPVALYTFPAWFASLLSAVLFAFSYVLFSWLVQLRNFWIALVVSVFVVIVVRLVLG